MTYEDMTLKCREDECQKEFVWSADDQKFYAEKGLQQPKRCPECRAAKKAAMNKNRSNFGGNRNYNDSRR